MYNEPNISNTVTFLNSKNYTDAQIKIVFNNFRKIRNRLNSFESNYLYYEKNMIKLNYSDEQIKALFLRFPRVVFHRFSQNKLRACHIDYLNSLKEKEEGLENKEEKNISFEFSKIKKILENLGFSKNRIDYAFKIKADVIYMDPIKLTNNIKFYLNYGLTKEELCVLARRNSKILKYGEEEYQELFDVLKFYSITKYDFMGMLEKIVKTSSMFTMETALYFFKWSLTKKFNRIKFGKVIKKMPIIISYTSDYLEEHYQNVIKLGFTEEETNKMISDTISILEMNYDHLKNKMDILNEYYLSEEEKHKLVYEFSAYFTMSNENIRSKLDVITNFDLMEYVLKKPKNLIQGAKTTEARAEYLLTFYPDLPYNIFCRDVFTSNKGFYKRYSRYDKNVELIIESKILQKK